jgi:hypothetical protein
LQRFNGNTNLIPDKVNSKGKMTRGEAQGVAQTDGGQNTGFPDVLREDRHPHGKLVCKNKLVFNVLFKCFTPVYMQKITIPVPILLHNLSKFAHYDESLGEKL